MKREPIFFISLLILTGIIVLLLLIGRLGMNGYASYDGESLSTTFFGSFFSSLFGFSPSGEYSPDSSTQLLLHMNGDAVDSSGNGKNGALVGDVNCNVEGKFGKGCEFDGNGDCISIGDIEGIEEGLVRAY